MPTVIAWPTLYRPTAAGRAYLDTFTQCLQAGYPTCLAVEMAERARDRVLLLQEQREKNS